MNGALEARLLFQQFFGLFRIAPEVFPGREFLYFLYSFFSRG